MKMVTCLLLGSALVASPRIASAEDAKPATTYTADDVRAAFRLGLMQGARQEHDREAEAAMTEAAKGAKNILPALQAQPKP